MAKINLVLVGLCGGESNFGLIKVIIIPMKIDIPKQRKVDQRNPICLFLPIKYPTKMQKKSVNKKQYRSFHN